MSWSTQHGMHSHDFATRHWGGVAHFSRVKKRGTLGQLQDQFYPQCFVFYPLRIRKQEVRIRMIF